MLLGAIADDFTGATDLCSMLGAAGAGGFPSDGTAAGPAVLVCCCFLIGGSSSVIVVEDFVSFRGSRGIRLRFAGDAFGGAAFGTGLKDGGGGGGSATDTGVTVAVVGGALGVVVVVVATTAAGGGGVVPPFFFCSFRAANTSIAF